MAPERSASPRPTSGDVVVMIDSLDNTVHYIGLISTGRLDWTVRHRVPFSPVPEVTGVAMDELIVRSGPARVLAALAEVFDRLADRGLLTVPDPAVAAEHFAFLVLGRPLDRGMFHVEASPVPAELNASADRAVTLFLAGYRS